MLCNVDTGLARYRRQWVVSDTSFLERMFDVTNYGPLWVLNTVLKLKHSTDHVTQSI